MPKVSVIIPCFNRPKMLKRAVCSVLSQSYKNFELILVNDGSTIDLSAIFSLVKDSGHQVFHTENKGVAHARNTALKMAKGEWIALLDSDDEWLESKLEKQLKFHAKNPKLKISQTLENWYRDGKFVNKKKAHSQPEGDAFSKSLQLCCISSSSVILKREIYENLANYDENLIVCEDYEFWLRVTAKYSLGLVSDILVNKYGGHEDQLSKKYKAMDRFRVYSIIKNLNFFESNKKKQAFEELKRKVNILLLGAKKHNPDLVSFYEDLLSSDIKRLSQIESFIVLCKTNLP